MALEAEILVNNYGVSREFAEKLVGFTGDIEGAIQLLEASEKDVVVMKGKFISSKTMRYGAIIIFYNYQSHIPEFIHCAVSSEIGLSKIRIESDWREFLTDMKSFMEGKEADHDAAARIEAEILSSNNVSYVAGFFQARDSIDLVNLKRFLLSSISKILLDSGLVLKFTTKFIDVFKFKNVLSTLKHGLKIVPKKNADLIMLINLKIDPVLAPLGGVDIEKVSEGESILVKVTDERDIVKYSGKLIGAIDESGMSKAVFGKVVRNKRNPESDNNLVSLEFGPGIYGSFIVGSKVRVQTKDSKEAIKADVAKAASTPPSGQKTGLLDESTMNTLRGLSGEEIEINDGPLDNESPMGSKSMNRKMNSKYFNYIIIGLIAIVTILLIILIFA